MSLNSAPPPLQSDVVSLTKQATGGFRTLITAPWEEWFRALITRVDTTAQSVTSVALTNQSASIGTTAIPTGALSAGVYRVNVSARITTVGSVSSSLAVTIAWTDGGVACSQTIPAVTGNTTSTTLQDVIALRSDASVAISYATTYASNAGAEMKYALDVMLESL